MGQRWPHAKQRRRGLAPGSSPSARGASMVSTSSGAASRVRRVSSSWRVGTDRSYGTRQNSGPSSYTDAVRVIVAGAGVFGTWTAYHLLEAGAAVTLID